MLRPFRPSLLLAESAIIAAAGLVFWNLDLSAQKPLESGLKPPVQKAKGKAGGKGSKAGKAALRSGAAGLFAKIIESSAPELQRDFPDVCLDPDGTAWLLFVENDGKADTLKLGRRGGEGIEIVGDVSEPGVIHQPAIAADGAGAIWCIWGQKDGRNVITLRARRFVGGEMMPEEEIARSEAGESFADAGTDTSGRLWVCWQKIQPGHSVVRVRFWDADAKGWGETADVAAKDGGNWEPRLAFDDRPGAWVAYDSSAGGEFNLRLAHVDLAGKVDDHALTDSPEYEARADLAWDGAGGFWVVAERGRTQWGLDSRGHENDMGLNAHKRLLLGRFDIGSGEFREVPVIDKGRPTPSPAPSPGAASNVPSIVVSGGHVWITYRYFLGQFWAIALVRYEPATGNWSEPQRLPKSSMGQDRRCEVVVGKDGELEVTWPSDHRATKACQVSAVHLANVDASVGVPAYAGTMPEVVNRLDAPRPYLNATTPPRPLGKHDTWEVGGKTYRLCWGDLHRHTDISNCRTGFDGCIVEAYRYAYDMAGLDFLGTSDHTDVGKPYHPYEWWHTQRHVDVFHAPGRFASLYAYEREQKFPWGHRNIVFAEHGGPILYINRTLYRNSPWQAALPIRAGIGEITPQEVWDVLGRYGKAASVISHTGATGMGTDWTRYTGGIDNTYENTVEIFQGARVSYEGIGLPQPTVGLRKGEAYTPHRLAGKEHPLPPAPLTDFDAGLKGAPGYNKGVYQRALSEGHKLGVFASSDHISTHTSFGGVYVEEFTREGIIGGFNARRTLAATDKIFVHFQCGDHLMGDSFATAEKPTLEFQVAGTAELKRVTLVRNEANYQVFEPGTLTMNKMYTDAAPEAGENRYYLRIEQADGNMAWTSPLWVRYEGK